jgi:hypothetical protein
MEYKKFVAARGSRLTDEQAQRFGEHIETIMEGRDGDATAQVVYEDARKKRSPLHSFFEWDDAVAAEAYRLDQAEYIVRSIHRVVKHDDGSEEEVLAFHSVVVVRPDATAERTYATLARVLSEEELRSQILARAMHEFEQWRKRYNQYQELAPLFKVYEKVKAQVA